MRKRGERVARNAVGEREMSRNKEEKDLAIIRFLAVFVMFNFSSRRRKNRLTFLKIVRWAKELCYGPELGLKLFPFLFKYILANMLFASGVVEYMVSHVIGRD